MGYDNSLYRGSLRGGLKHDDVKCSRDLQNVQKKGHSQYVDHGYSKGVGTGAYCGAYSASPILPSPDSICKLNRAKSTVLKKLGVIAIPFAVVTTTFLSKKADAASFINMPTPKIPNFIPKPIEQLADFINGVVDWFHNLPDNIAHMSTELLSGLYQLCADLIMKTPVWIFTNDWFSNTTLMFSGLSLGIVTALTVLEAMKRQLSGFRDQKMIKIPKAMEFKEILKRWFLVAGLTTAVPWLWSTAFKSLNFVSDFLIKIGADNMKGLAQMGHFTAFDCVTMLVFDAVLIGTVIPVLWQNGRRFFDLIVLGVITPLALTAWIFDDYRGLFNQWWSQVKHLSLVQVYHALFLLVLGWFIFGVGTPATFVGFVTKVLVVIGGFARMTSPPKLVAKHLDSGKDFGEVTGGVKETFKKTKRNYEMTKAIVGGPLGIAKKLATIGRK